MDLNIHQPLTDDEITYVKGITNTGKLYYDYDPLIEQARNHAFYECRQFNQSFVKEGKGNMQFLEHLFGKLGKSAQIEVGFITEFGFNLRIGNDFFAGRNLKMIDCNTIIIGDHVTIGNECGIYTSNHAMDPHKRANHWVKDLPITIGNDVWIEDGVTILPGVTIGDHAVIQAGSVVTHDIDSNTIASGVPCKSFKREL